MKKVGYRPRLTKEEQYIINEYRNNTDNRVLVIGDVHAPFGKEGYLQFCIETYKKYQCNKVVNHDAIIMRKAQSSSIPSKWIKNYNEVLGTPNWKWVTDVIIDDVRYVHGHKSSKARTAAKRDMQSTVTGHFHTDMYVEWMFGANKAVFAMAVGCGIDSKSYAMGYMQGGKKEAIGCGVVLDNGKTPINVKMDLCD